MNADQAEATLQAVMRLAISVRDEGHDVMAADALAVLATAGGDIVAALATAAALIDIDAPLQRWWRTGGQRSIGALVEVVTPRDDPREDTHIVTYNDGKRHGTRGTLPRCRRDHFGKPCTRCVAAEREYQADRHRRRYAARRALRAAS